MSFVNSTDKAPTAPRLKRFRINNYRSIGSDGVDLSLPQAGMGPLVLIGENNAGKSNILRAIEMLFGERWPGSWQPEDHDYFNRVPASSPIKVRADVTGVHCHFKKQVDCIEFEPANDYPLTYECECGQGRHTSNLRGDIRERLFAYNLTSSFDIRHQLSYGSQWTLLSKLMKQFHKQLISDPFRECRLQQIFKHTKDIFEEVEEFRSFKDELIASSGALTANLQYALQFDFSAYDPSNYFRSLRIHPVEADAVRSFEELGSGQQQLLMLAFAQSYAKAFRGESSLILLCDEPETHLHPVAQRVISRNLRELSSGSGMQIVVSTHSPIFIDLTELHNIVMVRKEPMENCTYAHQMSTHSFKERMIELGEKADSKNLKGEALEASSTTEIKAAMFSRGVEVVEGSSEPLAYPPLLRLLGAEFDTDHLGISFVNACGISSVAKWVRFFRAFEMNTYAIYDTDNWKPENGRHRKSIWGAVGGDPGAEPTHAEVVSALHVSSFAALQNDDFETMARVIFGDRWQELQDDATVFIGRDANLKPLRARFSAERIGVEELSYEATESFLKLGNQLRALIGLPPSVPSVFDVLNEHVDSFEALHI